MAKDQNTFAKKQREMEKKRKADLKRERRAKKKQEMDDLSEPTKSNSLLTSAEHSVLNVFRKYLMNPGKMLCFYGSDLEAFNLPLAQLIGKRMLVSERYKGGYSLSETGFAAMLDAEAPQPRRRRTTRLAHTRKVRLK